MIRDALPRELREALEDDCDIVVVVLRRVRTLAPGLDPRLLSQIESEVRAAYGGLRVRIPKRGKHLSVDEREAVFQDGLTTQATEDILRKHKISRATLYRQMKRGSRFDK